MRALAPVAVEQFVGGRPHRATVLRERSGCLVACEAHPDELLETIEKALEQRRIAQMAFDQATPAHGVGMAAREVVEGGELAAGLGQALEHVRADVAGATDNEDMGRGRGLAGD